MNYLEENKMYTREERQAQREEAAFYSWSREGRKHIPTWLEMWKAACDWQRKQLKESK